MPLQLTIHTRIETTDPRRSGPYVITFTPDLVITDLYEYSSAPVDRFELLPVGIIKEALGFNLLSAREAGFWSKYEKPMPRIDTDSETKEHMEFFLKHYLSLQLSPGNYRTHGRIALAIADRGQYARMSSPPHVLQGEIWPIHGNSSVSFEVVDPD